MAFWGLVYIWTKIVLKYYEPLTAVFLRCAISAIILLLFIRFFRTPRKIKKEHYKLFAISALFNPFLVFLLEGYGLKMVSSTTSAVIVSTIPLFTPIVAYFSLKERITSVNFTGILVSFIGILIMLLNKDFHFNENPKGILLLFIAVFAAVFYGIMLKKLTNFYSSLTIITYQNTLAALYFLPIFLIFNFQSFIKVELNTELTVSLLSLAIFSSSLAYILYANVIRKIGISKASMYNNLIPAFTAIFAFFILAEDFPFSKIFGMIVVILGVILSQLNRLTTKTKLK